MGGGNPHATGRSPFVQLQGQGGSTVALAHTNLGALFQTQLGCRGAVDAGHGGLPVTGAVEVSEPVVVTQIPALDVVVVTVNGSYDGISKAMSAVATWMDTHGVTVAGPMYNRYLVSPAQTENPDEWVTEVCVPVANT